MFSRLPRLLRPRTLAAALTAALALTTGPALAADAALVGPDVSSYQHPRGININWAGAHATGHAAFAFVKATEGTGYVNPYLARDFAGLSANHAIRGAYHFARPAGGPSNAVAQARHFVAATGGMRARGELPGVLDLEVTGGLRPAALIAWTGAYLAEVRRLSGRTPIVYTYPAFWRSAMANTRAFTGYPLWIATYGSQPALVGGWTRYTFWQYTDHATLAGVSGPVDMSVFNGSTAQLLALGNAAPKPAPKPAPRPAPKPAPKPTRKPIPKPVPKPAPKPVPKPVPAPKPAVPGALSLTASSGTSAGTLTVSWSRPAAGGAPTSYLLTVDGGHPVRQPAATTATVLTGLKPGPHRVSLAAVNAAGTGPAAAAVGTALAGIQLAVTGLPATVDATTPVETTLTVTRADTGTALSGAPVSLTAVWRTDRPPYQGATSTDTAGRVGLRLYVHQHIRLSVVVAATATTAAGTAVIDLTAGAAPVVTITTS